MVIKRLLVIVAVGVGTLSLWYVLFDAPTPNGRFTSARPSDHSIAADAALAPRSAEVAPADLQAVPSHKPRSGPDRMREFFAHRHEPYGAVLPPGVQASIWAQIERLPAEEPTRGITGWKLVGPSGMVTAAGALYSGRVLDLNIDPVAGTRVAAASGGLWDYELFTPVPLTDVVTSQWIGTVDVDPTDENTIIIGTGEYLIEGGTGVWKSTDGGATWANKSVNPDPSSIFRIRYAPFGGRR